MANDLRCWKCGAPFGDIPLPLARAAECRSCRAALHCCRQCEFYDTGVANACREPVAEKVQDKTRANFCGYLRPSVSAYRPAGSTAADQARAELDALFGTAPDKPSGESESGLTPAELARRKLDELFRK